MMQQRLPAKRKRDNGLACQLCRSKKLKCDPLRPCSNCLTRGAACENQTSQHNVADIQGILARLKRLEDLVVSRNDTSTLATVDRDIHAGVIRPSYALAERTVIENQDFQEAQSSGSWLEEVGSRNGSLLPGLSDQMAINIGTMEQAIRGNSATCIWLPPKEQGDWLFATYVKNVTHLHHVIHVPSVRTLIDQLYFRLTRGQQPLPSQVGLALSMFASTTYFLTPQDNRVTLFTTEDDAHTAMISWTKATLDVLEHSRRTSSGAIEDVQATIILSFVMYQFEGFSARARSLSFHAFTMARELGLHKIDSPKETERTAAMGIIQAEVSRRVWWNIVSTDWLGALQAGPQDGTYLTDPRHMSVHRPLNINDEDLKDDNEPVDRPLLEPTSMAYFLQRLRLADICRSAVDSIPPFMSLGEAGYEVVLALDGKLETFLEELPVFFRLDEDSVQKSQIVDQTYPQIPVQRFLIGVHAHMKRCKLHQPFLTQGLLEARYTHSRQSCLDSARAVIRLGQQIHRGKVRFASADRRFLAIVYYIFMATVVLVMDLCFNKTKELEEQRREEVSNALKTLEAAHDQSRVARTYLDSLMIMLRKHQIQLRDQEPRAAEGHNGVLTAQPETLPPLPGQLAQNTEPGFEEVWQDFVDFGPKLDVPGWDDLFSDLDAYAA